MKFVDASARNVGQFWQPNCSLNITLQQKYNTPDGHDYRYYLQQNAEQIMQDLRPVQTDDCKKCPICMASLSYKPTGNIQPKQQ